MDSWRPVDGGAALPRSRLFLQRLAARGRLFNLGAFGCIERGPACSSTDQAEVGACGLFAVSIKYERLTLVPAA